MIELRNKWVSKMIHLFAPINAWLLKSKPPKIFMKDLLNAGTGTLGKETALILKEQHYDLIPHYESHDIKHVLLEYPMNALGEVRMQFFALGNGNLYPPTWGICLLGLMLFPNKLKLFRKDIKRGRQSISLTHMKLKDWIHIPIIEARKMI
jgi:ubiquinone biosynthesis protein Coq4